MAIAASVAGSDLRVLVVTEHASAKFGGEAALGLHYFRLLRRRGIAVWLVTHARTRCELLGIFAAADRERIVFVPDTALQRLLWRVHRFLPDRIATFTSGYLSRVVTQRLQRRIVRNLVREHAISVVHQPMPVSPKEPSMMFDVGAPVIIGPMNGGMDYPGAFRAKQSRLERCCLAAGRALCGLANSIIPGKRRAALLLVANARTREALPPGVCNNVELLPENGVDLQLWRPSTCARPRSRATRYVFLGRLVDCKGVDLLIEAFSRASREVAIHLSIVGDGEERRRLEALARAFGLDGSAAAVGAGKVAFRGWMAQEDCAAMLREADALVLPSLHECGGAVVLEAMAMQIPVIATDWGGPSDYLDARCGILVPPESRQAFVDGLAAAMVQLARDPEQRIAMGKAGRQKVLCAFDWESKVDVMLSHYERVARRLSEPGRGLRRTSW